MKVLIQKWGNSLGLKIPMQIAKLLQLRPGSRINFKVENDSSIIQASKYDLETLLKGITRKNRHDPVLEYDQKGNETW